MVKMGDGATAIWAAATRTLSAFDAAALGVPADVWAAAARTLTAFDARALFDLPLAPSYYPVTIPTASATANTFGSWVQISADVGADRRLIGAHMVLAASQPASVEVEFGEGASAAEAAVARATFRHQLSSDVGMIPGVYIPLWVALTDNARLSVRVRCSFAAAFDLYVAAQVV